jgi:DNA-binding CsgD family transcriptional regulator
MSMTRESTPVDAWFQWCATEKQAACRAHLCTRHHLNTLDTKALTHAALLQVCRHWSTLDHPLAYVWQTLTHAGAKQGRRRDSERQQLRAYAQQRRLQVHGAACTAEHVAAVLARMAPRQRRLLAWYAQGYTDAQVAARLTTTPEEVRVARRGAYRALQAQFHSSSRRYHFRPCRTWAFLRPNPKMGSRKDNDLQASTCLFSVLGDSTFTRLGSTTTQEHRMYKAARLSPPRVVYAQSLGLDETLRAKEIVR